MVDLNYSILKTIEKVIINYINLKVFESTEIPLEKTLASSFNTR